ncbi:hypothetical protein HDU97_006604 [Phlyctochytrium planicorne]|nr:hypothetical protein HDU97_006604 [Phlyctochytrium planicorne]
MRSPSQASSAAIADHLDFIMILIDFERPNFVKFEVEPPMEGITEVASVLENHGIIQAELEESKKELDRLRLQNVRDDEEKVDLTRQLLTAEEKTEAALNEVEMRKAESSRLLVESKGFVSDLEQFQKDMERMISVADRYKNEKAELKKRIEEQLEAFERSQSEVEKAWAENRELMGEERLAVVVAAAQDKALQKAAKEEELNNHREGSLAGVAAGNSHDSMALQKVTKEG